MKEIIELIGGAFIENLIFFTIVFIVVKLSNFNIFCNKYQITKPIPEQ